MQQVESLNRALGAAKPNTWNPESSTIEAVISTGAPVQRTDARGPFLEVLDTSKIEPASLVGLPLLDAHRTTGSEHVVGKIISARREGAAIVATLQISKAPDAVSVATKVAEGSLSGVSIGYRVSAWAETSNGGKRFKTATNWEISEASLVPIPADPSAKTRSLFPMTNPANPEAGQEPDQTTTRAAIRQIARTASLPAEWADAQIDSGADVIAVRAAAFEELSKRSKPALSIQIQSNTSNDNPELVLQRRADALAMRAGVNPEAKSADAARQYASDSLADHARALLTMRGILTTGLRAEEVLTRAHTTGDFPALLNATGQRFLLPAYQAAQSPLKALARQSTRSDFRPGSALQLGGIGTLGKVTESGEIKQKSRSEAVEAYALDTYAAIFTMTRRAALNDDLGAFRDWGTAAGRAAAATEADLLHQLLASNPTMGDGKALFHVDRGNLLSATPDLPLHENGLTAARKAMRAFKDSDGTLIQTMPKYLLVGPELETFAEKVLTILNAAVVDEVNPFAGKLTLMVDPRILGDDWYIFAEPATVPVMEYSYLSGAPGPQLATRQGFEVLATEMRVHLDFGAGVLPGGWAGAVRSPGPA